MTLCAVIYEKTFAIITRCLITQFYQMHNHECKRSQPPMRGNLTGSKVNEGENEIVSMYLRARVRRRILGWLVYILNR